MLTPESFNAMSVGTLHGLLGIEVIAVAERRLTCQIVVRPDLLAPNGYLHAGTVVAVADTACGYGCIANLPEGAQNFTTIELKSNFLGTVREGIISCTATLLHGGRTTQVWDAQVTEAATGKIIALFRCTQMVLYPRGV